MTKAEVFASWLQDKLEYEGWSQTELADRSGITRTHISRILSGERSPGLDFYRGIAHAFRIPLCNVLAAAGEVPENEAADDPTTAGLLSRLATLPAPSRQPLLDLFHSILDLAPALAAVPPAAPSVSQPVSASSSSPNNQVHTLPEGESKVIPFLRKPKPTLDDFSAWLDELPPEVLEELARSIIEREDAEAVKRAPKARRA